MVGLGSLARKIFGSSNDRRIKAYGPRVAAINALEAGDCRRSPTTQLRARTDEFRAKVAAGTPLDDLLVPGLRHRPRGRQAHARPAPFRRAADRRHGPARGRDRRDEDRRGQDAGRDARRLSQRARRQGRPRRHRQRLPRPPRRRVDGPDLQLPRPDGRRHRPRPRRRPAPRRLRLRHHLRHQQRVRLRLSARQHEVRAARHGAARAQLRDRRRGRLDPDRRGAHAADHLRPARRPLRALQSRSTPSSRSSTPEDYEVDEKQRTASLHRGRQREARGHPHARPACSRATRSTTSRTSPSSTTSTRRCAPTGCSSATRTTSSGTTRSSSSTSSPAA